jgi:hypothetical protein
MDLDHTGSTAIRRWTVQRITLIVDNTEDIFSRVNTAAAEAVREGVGYPSPTRADYEYMLRTGDRRDEYTSVVGTYVCEALEDWLTELGLDTDPRVLLLRDLLSLEDSVQAEMLGNHYLPERADDIDWSSDDDDDEDQDPPFVLAFKSRA